MTESWFELGLLSVWSTGMIWASFRLFLSGERRHTLHRCLLLMAPLLAPIFWLLRRSAGSEITANLPELTLPEVLVNGPAATESGISIAMLILVGGAVLRLGMTAIRMGRLWWLAHTGHKVRSEGAVWVRPVRDVPVASFFHWIFWREPENCSPEMRNQLRAHELCHVRQGHSWDLLYLEILSAIFWFNPFMWLIRGDLRTIHEYLADQAALEAGSRESYHKLILSTIFPGKALALSHPFFTSTLKKRILMMKNLQNPLGGSGKYLLLLPLFALIFSVSLIRAQAPADPDPSEVIEFDNQPTITNLNEVVAAIGYPAKAKEAGLEGKEIVRIKFDQAGNYAEHVFLKSDSPIFKEAIEKHISEMKATPAVKDGKPVAVWLTIPFAFKMPKKKE